MAKPKTIIIEVAPGGKVTVEADGFTGKTCVEATAFIEQALGPPASKRRTKPAYNQPVKTNLRTKIGG
jgi:hypothetical protein